jgi:type II secretory pathway pseudopilin PulG
MKQARRSKFVSARAGLSLPEAMISLAITSLLLVAVATAFTNASQAIEMNDSFFRCSQAARVTMDQMLGEIRNCDSLDMSTANTIKIIRPVVGSGLYARQTNETERDFVYDTTNQRITLQIMYSTGTNSPVYELASNVTTASFGPATMGTDYNGATIPIQVPLTVTVQTGVGNGSSTVVLNGSAGPRRATKY